ncbi:DUF4157 domain-containing protein [Mesorhizobium sp. M0045]|uniref:CBM35 domain-containing protein n=1 Tax=Mesorhizobium sp. M0045 TaxID=2956857 RepID=UPI00333DF767
MAIRIVNLTVIPAVIALLIAVVLSPRPASACKPFQFDCDLREAGRKLNTAVIKGSHDVNREFSKGFNQARTDLSNGLDHIDPRITQLGRDFDTWRRNFIAYVISGPTLEVWLRRSRNDAIHGSRPIPKDVRQAMKGWYSGALMNGVGYKIGQGGELNLAHGSLTYGDAKAITLIDVIVFKNADIAKDMSIWAHELHHVSQFNDWGLHSFAVQYARSVNSVENPAYEVQARYAAAYDPTTNTAPLAKSPAKPVPTPVSDMDRLPIILKMTQATSLEGSEVGGGLAANYGKDVLHNMPPYGNDRPNAANFNFRVPVAGRYELNIEYAAAQSRPVSIIINGQTVAGVALSDTTGGWEIDQQTWHDLFGVNLNAGQNTIRIERPHVFPHIRTIAFQPIS